MAMHDSIFRKYDIRGITGSELDLTEVYRLGQAIARYFLAKNPLIKAVAVGMDGRVHSPQMRDDLCRALQESGLDVIFIGICPSPTLYFSLHYKNIAAGVMITASHNPGEYNGFKICLGEKSVWGDELQVIKALYHDIRVQEGLTYSGAAMGSFMYVPMVTPYVEYLVDHFSHLRGMQQRIVIDCANGAAGAVLPALVAAMDWPHVQLLYPEIDGTYPNHEADPTVEENMDDIRAVIDQGSADYGIGLDGDADRMAVISESRTLIPGDKLLALFAADMKDEHPGMGVVCDIKSSMGLLALIAQWGLTHYMVPCGHSYVKEKMDATHAILGGEFSCHFCFSDRYFGYDDGIYATLRFIEIVAKTGKTVDQLLSIFPYTVSSPELRIPCAQVLHQHIIDAIYEAFTDRSDATMLTIDGIRVHVPYGWGNVRASNTQPVLSVRFESTSKQELARIKEDFFVIMKQYIDEEILQLYFKKGLCD
ncbi:MAG: phosphomannomutase/phosphoglucomutase [Candidatus Babeliales bacterium]